LDSQHALNAKTGKWGDASPVKEIIAQISGLVKTLDYSSLTNNATSAYKINLYLVNMDNLHKKLG